MKKLTIGIVDGLFYSLQARLLSEGHKVRVYVPGGGFDTHLSGSEFNLTDQTKQNNNLTHCLTIPELAKGCDLIITDTLNGEGAYEYVTSLGIPTLGHSLKSCFLENDRELAKMVVTKACKKESIKQIKIPETKIFANQKEAVSFLKKASGKWVIKQTSMSPKDFVANPTVVIEDPSSFAHELDKPVTAWFKDGIGGCQIEKKIEGQEVCFGAWFNGEEFILPMYSCIEHKGAQNSDRGSILTGEVGTTIKMHTSTESRMWKLFQAIAPALKGECCGMIDINTILTPKGDQYFLEFTIRFGRPTLELLLAHMKPEFNLGKGLLALAIRSSKCQDIWDKAYRGDYSVGVTAFTYGYPVINSIYEQLPESVQQQMDLLMPTNGTYVSLVNPSNTNKAKIMQFLATYDGKHRKWQLSPNNRQFVFVGHGEFPENAIANAYDLLGKQNLFGLTWRDDIGGTLISLDAALSKWNIA